MAQQVLVIHGGTSFKTYDDFLSYLINKDIKLDKFRKKGWKANLRDDLGGDYDVLTPRMPNSKNAKYKEWKIWFTKIIQKMDKNILLIGHSLGGIFLAKYLSENKISKNIIATILVAAPFNNDGIDGESLKKFALPQSLGLFAKQSKRIYLLHSIDDPVVPLVHVKKYKKSLAKARVKIYKNMGHFTQEHFPEIASLIQKID